MVKRHYEIDFASGALVFPGGCLAQCLGRADVNGSLPGFMWSPVWEETCATWRCHAPRLAHGIGFGAALFVRAYPLLLGNVCALSSVMRPGWRMAVGQSRTVW